MPNNFVLIKAFIKEGWLNRDTGQRGKPKIQYRMFKQLQDVMETFSKKLTIQLDINTLREERIALLRELLSNHRGDHILNFVVYELKDRIKVHMPSRRQKVKISSALLGELEKERFEYRVN